MTETTAIRKLDTMQQELRKPGYTFDYRDFNLQPQQTRIIDATDLIYFVSDEVDDNIVVRSETGVYDRTTTNNAESIHHHTGRITLENHSLTAAQYVVFYVGIWH